MPPLDADARRHGASHRATTHDPAERYPDAAALLAALAAAGGARGPPRRPPARPATRTRACGRSWRPTRPTSAAASGSCAGWPTPRRRPRCCALVGPVRERQVLGGARRAGPGGARRRIAGSQLVRGRDAPGRGPVRRARRGARAARATAPRPPGRAARGASDGLVRRRPRGCCPTRTPSCCWSSTSSRSCSPCVADEERRAAFLAALRAAAPTRAAACASCSRCAPTSSTGRSPMPASPRSCAPAPSSSCRCSADELERAISGPARRAGVAVEAGLLAELVPTSTASRARCRCCSSRWPSCSTARRRGADLGGVPRARRRRGRGRARRRGRSTARSTRPRRERARQLFLRLVDPEGGARRRVLRERAAVADAERRSSTRSPGAGCSPSTAIRRRASRRWRSPMTRCCARGTGCASGSPKRATTSVHSAGWHGRTRVAGSRA